MIPKTIHFIWLGQKKKPKNFSFVYKTWEANALNFGYEIKEWNEENISEFDLPAYFHEALRNRKWAFASDVLRFYILRKYGGFYFDVDQVLISNLNEFLDLDFVISKYHESDNYYGFGLIGEKRGGDLSEKMVRYFSDYRSKSWIIVNKIGSSIINEIIRTKGTLGKFRILEQEYFYPLTKSDFTKNTHSYHLANTSWVPAYKRFLYRIPFYEIIKGIAQKYLPQKVKQKLGFNIQY